ncbi:MAG: peptidyl-prolyl cis-trans isomerase [Deltaproteobacteria bacterium]|jgi:hypothetical protein|nr:peptidyl-prolyl cis-trans isomerase [Deltaproteobacteria bacterium]
MIKFLKEPLLHFLVAGLALFVLFEFIASDEADYDARIIDVNRDALLTFIQFRSQAFEPRVAAARLDSLTDAEFERLVADYVREEALHREALALGVDKNDYIIKRRMIQSIEFITNGFVTANVEVSDSDVAEYFDDHRDDYFIEPFVTFTHVFFGVGERSEDAALAMAQAKRAELNRVGAIFSDATRHGERFPYFVNYVERDPGFVVSHFGQSMADALFDLAPSDTEWQGPFISPYGAHVVLLTRNVAGRHPELDEVLAEVRQDAERAVLDATQEAAIDAIVSTYEVRRDIVRRAGVGP